MPKLLFDCRLLATAGTWFLWDFSFYGNKVFQSSFIAILSPGASLFTTLLWTLLNSGKACNSCASCSSLSLMQLLLGQKSAACCRG